MPDFQYPLTAFVIVPGEALVAKVDRWESGYAPRPSMTPEQADRLNERLGVSHAMRESMLVGSMFGWHVPGSKPERAAEIYASAEPLTARARRRP